MLNKVTSLVQRLPKITFISYFLSEGIRKILNRYSISSYSQFGEDRFLDNYFHNIDKGFYVDIGCNHPVIYSNTWKLYLKGWRGIAIDANPQMIDLFRQFRPKDIPLNEVLSDKEKTVQFYFNKESSLISGIGEKLEGHWKRTMTNSILKEVTTTTLEIILDKNDCTSRIDLLCIDVEGEELNILRSLNLNKYKPTLILVEIHDLDIVSPQTNLVYQLLRSYNYEWIGYLPPNAFFQYAHR